MDLLASVGWPVLDRFHFGDAFAISPHGIGIAVGFLVGAAIFQRRAPRWGIRPEHAAQVVFWALIGAIVGARFFYVLAHLEEYASPLEWLEIWRGGISLLGGIAGATIANAIRIRMHGYHFFQVADPLVPGLALGIAVGRIGDLIIGDHLGKPTSWLLAWTYEGGTIAPPFSCVQETCTASLNGGFTATITKAGATLTGPGTDLAGVGVHQTALYDMLLAIPLAAFLFWFQRRARREGVVTLTFAMLYGGMRLMEDSLRIDKRFGPLTGSQWTSLAVVVISVAILLAFAFASGRAEEGPSVVSEPDVGSGDAAGIEHGDASQSEAVEVSSERSEPADPPADG
jgi:phosphatidylglycerol:prolipoprotein diacylglycerol transferase